MVTERRNGQMGSHFTELDTVLPSHVFIEAFEFFSARVIGQPKMVTAICNCIELWKSGFKPDKGPIGSFLFPGPTGTGKTLASEVLSEYIYGSNDCITKIPCEMCHEPHYTAMLIGAPPGYVGREQTPWLAQTNIDRFSIAKSEDRSQLNKQLELVNKYIEKLEGEILLLTNKLVDDELAPDSLVVRITKAKIKEKIEERYKYLEAQREILKKIGIAASLILSKPSIINFDEIEKANPTLAKTILAVVDEGKLPMASSGEVTDFSNSFVLMTSNAGAREIFNRMSGRGQIGFGVPGQQSGKKYGDKELNDLVYHDAIRELKKVFPPEFLPRIGYKVVTRPLSKEAISIIFDVELSKFVSRSLVPLKCSLEVGDDVKALVLSEATEHPEDGARLLKHKIRDHLSRPLGRLKNKGLLNPDDKLVCRLDSSKSRVLFFKEENPSV